MLDSLDGMAVTVDAAGNVYVTNYSNDRVRKLTLQTPAAVFSSGGNNQTGIPGKQMT